MPDYCKISLTVSEAVVVYNLCKNELQANLKGDRNFDRFWEDPSQFNPDDFEYMTCDEVLQMQSVISKVGYAIR